MPKAFYLLCSAFLILNLFLFCFALPATAQLVTDNLLITEVQISGGPGKTTYDFIELYNPTARPIDLKGWRLIKRTATGTADQTIKSWTNSIIISPGAHYLWANNDYTELVELANTTTSATVADNNGLALRQGAADSGQIIDSLAWGKTNNSLGEGTLLGNPPALHSLERKKINDQYQDTNNNAADFFLQTTPNPQSHTTGQAATTTKTTSSAGSNTASKTSASPMSKFVSLVEVKGLKSGDKITVEGIVAAVPGEIGPTIMFLSGSGLQLNLTGGAPEGIEQGQKVRVKGSVSKTIAYGTRLTIKLMGDIEILGEEDKPVPHSFNINELNTEHEGWLVATAGEIVQRGHNWYTLESKEARLRVNLRNSAHDWPKFLTHEQMNLIGFITLSQGELRLWPRSPDDIEIIRSQTTPSAEPQAIDLSQPEPVDWRGYIILLLLAGLLGGGWWWQKRKLPSPWQLIMKKISKLIKH